MPATFPQGTCGCRAFISPDRWRLASEMISTPRSTSHCVYQSISKTSSGISPSTVRMRPMASIISKRRRANAQPLKHTNRGGFDPLANSFVQAVAGHDVGRPAEDAGSIFLHIHKLEKTELSLFIVEKKVDIGTLCRFP